MSNSPIPNAELPHLLRRLTLYANGLLGLISSENDMGVFIGIGKSGEDFAMDAMSEFLEAMAKDPSKITADPDAGYFPFLATIVFRRAADARKRHSHIKTAVNTEDVELSISLEEAKRDGLEKNRADELFCEYQSLANGRAELEEILQGAAILATEQEYPFQSSDLAAFLDLSESEVRNGIRRLNYRRDKMINDN